jgi:hypothetical protein
MQCQNCQNANAAGSAVCQHCGSPLQSPANPVANPLGKIDDLLDDMEKQVNNQLNGLDQQIDDQLQQQLDQALAGVKLNMPGTGMDQGKTPLMPAAVAGGSGQLPTGPSRPAGYLHMTGPSSTSMNSPRLSFPLSTRLSSRRVSCSRASSFRVTASTNTALMR